MQPTVVNLPAFSVVGLRIDTTPMSADIPKLWDQFGPRIDEIGTIAEPQVSYGVMEMGGPTALTYMAGVSVTDSQARPPGMTAWDVPASQYVMVDTDVSSIGQAFDLILNRWLPGSGYQAIDGPSLERYGAEFSMENPVMRVYVPVARA